MTRLVPTVSVGLLSLGMAAPCSADPVSAGSSPPAAAYASLDAAKAAMRLLCSLRGAWTGSVEVIDQEGKSQRLGLDTSHECAGDNEYYVVRETFHMGTGESRSTVKVTYIDHPAEQLHTTYFSQGKESPYKFVAVSASQHDASSWTSVIASPPGSQIYEGRRATLRYTRRRADDRFEMTKEVLFDDDNSGYQIRSRILQTLKP